MHLCILLALDDVLVISLHILNDGLIVISLGINDTEWRGKDRVPSRAPAPSSLFVTQA
jgi:hypothetical protein